MARLIKNLLNMESIKYQGDPILVLDFDGCIHSYVSGWQGADVASDPPVPGTAEFLLEAVNHFQVMVYSTRNHQPGGIETMQSYIEQLLFDHTDDATLAKKLATVTIKYPLEKPPAVVFIDDNAVRFTGQWMDPKSLLDLKPWHKQEGN